MLLPTMWARQCCTEVALHFSGPSWGGMNERTKYVLLRDTDKLSCFHCSRKMVTFSWWYQHLRDVAGALVHLLVLFCWTDLIAERWAPAPLTQAVLTGTNSLIWTPS